MTWDNYYTKEEEALKYGKSSITYHKTAHINVSSDWFDQVKFVLTIDSDNDDSIVVLMKELTDWIPLNKCKKEDDPIAYNLVTFLETIEKMIAKTDENPDSITFNKSENPYLEYST